MIYFWTFGKLGFKMYYISYRSALITQLYVHQYQYFDYQYNTYTTIFMTLYRHINIVSDLKKRQVNSNGFEVDSEQ